MVIFFCFNLGFGFAMAPTKKAPAPTKKDLTKKDPTAKRSRAKKPRVSKELKERLVEAIKNCPMLWDKQSSDYHNSEVTAAAWSQFDEEYGIGKMTTVFLFLLCLTHYLIRLQAGMEKCQKFVQQVQERREDCQ